MTKVEIGNATQIYALCDPRNSEPRYIGKTVQPLIDRLLAHKRTALRKPRLPVHWWIKKVEGINLHGAYIKLLERVPSEEEWQPRERWWIEDGRRRGWRLLNLTEGGEGLHGHRFGDEHRRKIAASLSKGSHFNCENCGAEFWRKPSAIKAGDCRFCSRGGYQSWQIGKPKGGRRAS